ncbi:glycoside hydrolase family 10 protein [Apodospora peruviana]|uniref:Beta-xylanase n=1 Tax=Apodospora peruviana TaxID=516989 RepID=A0AAE0IJB6_9PEZI|nr:glycoside hydrolase family 10 protein [Apodospora peruviana]
MTRLLLTTKAVVAVAAFMAAAMVSAQATNQTTEGLHSLFVASGKLFFGTATETNNFGDSAYQVIVNNKNEFGMFVPENSQKWGPIEPTEGDFQFESPDSIVNRAEGNGQMFRCHALTWHSQLPAFVENGTWTRETLTSAIQTHIATVMGHYKGQCYSWDVVNEALNDNGTFRDSVFFRVLGTDFLPISFKAAEAADPTAKLYYNDFNLETIRNKTDAAVRIVELIRAAGARIDGLGFQAHFRVGGTPSQASLVATMNRFVDMGLEVALSELDIAHNSLPADSRALAQQSTDYVAAVGACLAVPKCVGITLWQFTDKYSWIPSTFPGAGDACLFSANFTKKPAYTAVKNLLTAVATGGGGGNGGNNSSAIQSSGSPPAPVPGTGTLGGTNDPATAALISGVSSISVVGSLLWPLAAGAIISLL